MENGIPLTCTVWTILNPDLNHRPFIFLAFLFDFFACKRRDTRRAPNCLAYNPTSDHSSSSVIHTHIRQTCGLWFFGGGFLFHFILFLIPNSRGGLHRLSTIFSVGGLNRVRQGPSGLSAVPAGRSSHHTWHMVVPVPHWCHC